MAYEMHVITCFVGDPPQKNVLIAESIIFRTKKARSFRGISHVQHMHVIGRKLLWVRIP